MKKYLPLILLLAGIIAVVVGFFVIRSRRAVEVDEDGETALLKLSPEESPIISLIPTDDGHYLTLKVEKIDFKPASVDYLLLYETAEEVQQGVPGMVNLDGRSGLEEKLLLGSESSGKFRYDEGVENGSVELKFRNSDGELMAKFETEFHLQKGVSELTSPDGNFSFSPDDGDEDTYFVTMQTVGIPGDDFNAVTYEDGYAVFASE